MATNFRSRGYSRAYFAAYRSLLSSEYTNHSANRIGIFIAVQASHLAPRSFLNEKGVISPVQRNYEKIVRMSYIVDSISDGVFGGTVEQWGRCVLA
jgi:hypothetical protein